MIDIVETATRIASSGFLIKMKISAWAGFIPSRPEWGDRMICSIPADAKQSVDRAKKVIKDTLYRRVIPCYGGLFIPKHTIPEWIKEHEEAKAKLAAIVNVIANSIDTLRDAACLAAAAQTIKVWEKRHPKEGDPPLSISSHASSVVNSIMPSKEQVFEKFNIQRTINTHYFLVTQKMDFLTDGEKRGAAWNTIDELVAGNIRKLVKRLEYAILQKAGHKRRFDRATETVITFRNTDVMPELGLSADTDELYNLVNNKVSCEVSSSALLGAMTSLTKKAKELSTVSAIIRRLG